MFFNKELQNVVFLNPFPLPVFFLAVAGLAAFLFFTYYRFSILTHFRFRVILGLLRALLFAAVLYMILDPYWNRPGNSDWLGVLIDTSKSMAVQDPGLRETRFQAMKSYLEKNRTWADLAKNKVRKYLAFDSAVREGAGISELKPEGMVSRLVAAAREVNGRFREDPDLLGWILFSDGAATDASEKIKQMIPDAFFPWITVGMGMDEEIPNIQLKYPVLKEPIFVGDVVSVRLEWESNLPQKTATLLTVKLDEKPLIQKQIVLDDLKMDFDFSPLDEGIRAMEISLDPLPGEGSAEDNKIRVLFKVSPRNTKVFYAESFYKDRNFFKEALEEDAGFQVSFASSVVGFSRKNRVPYIKDPLYGFPKSRAELFQYDAVVLSDVKQSLLSAEQIAWIRELVEKEGGALLMVGGMDSFGDGGYVGTPIEKMLPVEISEEYAQTNFLKSRGVNENPFRPVFAPSAESNPLMQLTSDPKKNKILWETMPALGGYNYVGRVKPGASLLLQHPTESSTFGPRSILAVQSFGRGKVLAFTSDVTPNWGEWFQEWRNEKEGWLYAKFWRNVLKNLTENKLRGRISMVEIQREPLLAETSQPITFTVGVPKAEEAQRPELRLEVLQNESTLLYEVFKNQDSQKVVWKIQDLAPGDYLMKAVYTAEGIAPVAVEHPFAVHSSREESAHLKMDTEVLKTMASQTQGVYLPFSKIGELDKAVAVLRKVQLRKKTSPLWAQPLFYLTFLTILGLDWLIRKKQGME